MIEFESIKAAGERHANMLKDKLIENRQVATRKTLGAIHSKADAKGYTIFGPRHIGALQFGRKPTSASGGDLYTNILEWVQAKRIVFSDGIKNSKYTIEERTAKTITYFIHKRGTYLYRFGRTYEGVSNPILPVFEEQVIREIASSVITPFFVQLHSEAFEVLDNLTYKQ